jgi:hypothetical protein
MMTPANIREHLRRQPFCPFRIRMSDGQSFDVRHPGTCMVGTNTLYVGIPHPREEELVLSVAHCSLLHIASIEPIDGKRPRATKRGKKQGS